MATWLFAFPAQAAARRGEWNDVVAVLDWLWIADCSCHQINPYFAGRRAEPHNLSLFSLLILFDMACHAVCASITCLVIFDERPKCFDCKVQAIPVPAHTRDPGGRRLQKLFHNQRSWSWGVLFSTGSRGNDNNCGSRILPTDLIVTSAQSVILGYAPALGLRPEQLRARIEGKQQHQ